MLNVTINLRGFLRSANMNLLLLVTYYIGTVLKINNLKYIILQIYLTRDYQDVKINFFVIVRLNFRVFNKIKYVSSKILR